MKPAPVLALALLALPLALRATPTGKKSATFRKGPYRFEIVTDSRVGEWFGWWGAPDTGRVSVITSVQAFRGNRRLPLPPSAFSGLADPHDYETRPTKRGMELVIVGSDAGEAWKGTFVFDETGILERTIQSGEFPDLHYERTVYRYIRPGEID